jgi:hypothetical protein
VRWIVALSTWSHGGSESRRQHRGTVGQSPSDDAVDWRCGDDVEARRITSGGDLEVRSVWTPAVIDLNPIRGPILKEW